MITQEDINAISRSMTYSDCGQPMYNDVQRHRAHNNACQYCQAAIRSCTDRELQSVLLISEMNGARYAIALDELNRRVKERGIEI